MRPNKPQSPLRVPNRPYWLPLAPLPWALMAYMISRYSPTIVMPRKTWLANLLLPAGLRTGHTDTKEVIS